MTQAQPQRPHQRATRVAAYAPAPALRQPGWTMQALSTPRGRPQRTVRQSLAASPVPARPPRRRPPSRLDPSQAALLERWQAGCRSVLELDRDRQAQGLAGQDSIVAASGSRVRPPPGRSTRRRRSASPATIVEGDPPLTPRRAPWWGRRREATLKDDAKQHRARRQSQAGESAEAITLPQDCAGLVRQRQPGPLDTGRARATARGLPACKRFAHGLRADDEAVKAGRTLPWSTGPVEGQIKRLQLRQRQMDGRAHRALLQQRVWLPTEARRVGDEQPAPDPTL
jgi:transposase